ncbi:MAG TPA: 23S rRNA (uracil(1939)-C(5))-methyltransferase RlmD [Candidatus Angelobacter sp.]|nr:23S rRNA (uracil(1939)-C(5))-methyltransferase RlmD [Candidatus Angelobacter sp.]
MNLTIEKLVYGGDGLARLPEGKTVFLPFVLPAEEISASIVQEKSSFARATLDQIVKPSPYRIKPACSYFGSCGGCHYQHAGYAAQLENKRAILKETLLRNGKLEWKGDIVTHPSEPWNYRNRSRFKVRGGADFAIGYHRMGTHDLLPVKECPISSKLINRVLQQLWELGEAGKIPAAITEIELFADHADTKMVLEVYLAPGAPEMHDFAAAIQAKAPEIKGVAFFQENAAANANTVGEPGAADPPKYTVGDTAITYQVGEKSFRVSAGSFFQVNRHLVRELVQTVAGDFHGRIALDLYAGVGLFASHLAKRFDQVFAVESAPASSADLQANAIKNMVPVKSTAEGFLPRCLNMQPELVVVDPPRAGLGPKATQLLAALRVKRIVYVSCDPATLARDVRLLLETGYHVEEVHLADLFPQTFHIESVVRLAR